MNDLYHTLNAMGLQSLELTESEQQQITKLLDSQASFFSKVVRQQSGKPQHDLVLGLLTKCYQEALENFQATEATINQVQSVFEETVGREQAQKFTTNSVSDVHCYAMLWFMAQGYTGIDFSYANDHANETAAILASSPVVGESDPNALRTRFMQSYYVGCHTAKTNQKTGFGLINRIKQFFSSHRSHS